jgi:hypothetical protein
LFILSHSQTNKWLDKPWACFGTSSFSSIALISTSTTSRIVSLTLLYNDNRSIIIFMSIFHIYVLLIIMLLLDDGVSIFTMKIDKGRIFMSIFFIHNLQVYFLFNSINFIYFHLYYHRLHMLRCYNILHYYRVFNQYCYAFFNNFSFECAFEVYNFSMDTFSFIP